ncbi:MAG: transglycosylase domain-containing protein [Persicimonas sp.]
MSQTSSETSDRRAAKRRRIVIYTAAALAVVAVIGAIGYWLVVPGVADRVVRSKLAGAQERFDLEIEVEEVATTGLSEVSLSGIEVRDARTDERLAQVSAVSTSIDGLQILLGRQHLSSVRVSEATLAVHRNADGETNLERILARGSEESDEADAESEDSSDKPPSVLRYFGGKFPDVEVSDGDIELTADDEAEPWPVEGLATDQFTLDARGDEADLTTQVDITGADSSSRWSVPESAKLEATLRLPLEETTGSVSLSSPLEVVDLPPYPFVRLGMEGFGLDEDHNIELDGLSLAVQGGDEPSPILSVEQFAVRFEELSRPLELEKLRPMEVRVERPVVHIEHDRQFGSAINDLHHFLRAPFARSIDASAHRLAEKIVEEEELDVEEPEEDDEGGLLARLGDIDWSNFLSDKAPQRLQVNRLGIQVLDARPLDDLVQSDPELALEEGNFEFTHRPIHGELVASGGFEATGSGDESRGSASGAARWNYRKGDLEFETDIDELSVPWLVQLVDGRLSKTMRGGYLHADIAGKRPKKSKRIDLDGLVSIEEFSFHHEKVTNDPVESVTASYDFEAFYDPEESWPEPKLIASKYLEPPEKESDKDDGDDDGSAEQENEDSPLDETPPQEGAVVVERGSAEFNGVQIEVRPALYGLDGLKRRPARFDLQVRLPRTGVDKLFAAVPEALKGPVAGAEMRGTFGWSLDLEAPLYRAGKMQWDSEPLLTGFELISLPDEVDVRRLTDSFELTLVDPELEWERDVETPEMRPVPIDWLVRHSGRDIEDFEEDREEREWPPMPYEELAEADPDELPEDLQPHERPWGEPDSSDDDAEESARDRDSIFGLDLNDDEADDEPTPAQAGAASEDEPDEPSMVRRKDREEEHPYGEYTYVPLQYISPWLMRAVMTTEDNSFFKHNGFNWYALKGSIEDNLEAGGFVRGASTIPMQLVKNLYLSRDKVLARKFQEAFLVWLMENEVDVPKERILELYFNVIEFGPGIFGIHDASVHYFGKRAEDLSLTEVAWLVSIIPQPKKHHQFYEFGEISPVWFSRMKRYVAIMKSRDRVSEEEYEEAKEDKPEFYKPDDDEPMMRPDTEDESVDDEIEEVDDDADEETDSDNPRLRDLMGP